MPRGLYHNDAEQAWDDADECNCEAGDCYENNHKECGLCTDHILYGSHESVIGQQTSYYRWNIDHKKATSKNGKNIRSNRHAVHVSCNQEKADN